MGIATGKPRRRDPRLSAEPDQRTPPDGAFMEPRGCNRWQSAANRLSAETAETRQNRCRGLRPRSEEHTSELQSRLHLVCRLLLEKKKKLFFFYFTFHIKQNEINNN